MAHRRIIKPIQTLHSVNLLTRLGELRLFNGQDSEAARATASGLAEAMRKTGPDEGVAVCLMVGDADGCRMPFCGPPASHAEPHLGCCGIEDGSWQGRCADNAAMEGFFGKPENEFFCGRGRAGVSAAEFMRRLGRWMGCAAP